jgi:hypothetical protein
MGSTCAAGLRVIRPCKRAKSSPNLFDIQAWADSCTDNEDELANGVAIYIAHLAGKSWRNNKGFTLAWPLDRVKNRGVSSKFPISNFQFISPATASRNSEIGNLKTITHCHYEVIPSATL